MCVLGFGLLFGQARAAGPAFEVASIRSGAPFSMELLRSGGIGMKIDPSRVTIRSWSLTDIVGAAYKVRADQIAGPDWMGTQRFDVQAKLPEGASADQVPEMLQALLVTRFHMSARRGQKEMPVYALTAKKGGLRMQQSSVDEPGPSGCTTMSGGHRFCHKMTMEDLSNLLTQLSRMYAAMPPGGMPWGIELPTVDQTGLAGTYDFNMDYGPGSEDAGGGSGTQA